MFSDSWSYFIVMLWFYYMWCDITLSFFIYSAGRYLFCELCSQPWHSVHHSLPPVRKCSNVTDPYELPDFWLPNSRDKIYFIIKYGAASLPEKKHRMWTIWGGIWLMYEFDWNRWLLTMAVISGVDVSCLHSSERRTFWIFTVTQISQNIINCNKLVKIFLSHLFQIVGSFLTFTFYKVVWRRVWGKMIFLMINALRNHCWVWWWNNCENRSTFAEVMGKN